MHISVLPKEVLEHLNPKTNENFIDCTVGEAGHSLAILERNKPQGKVLGIDWETENIKKLKEDRLILICDNFANLKDIVEQHDFQPISGILIDLGFSSWHTDESGKGFSFQKDEPLIMRYADNGLTAAEIINQWPEKEIANILKEYGEETFSRKIAKEITLQRKAKRIITTSELVEIIKKAIPEWYQHKKIHCATRTFQALRIAVNKELENLKEVLPQALEILQPNGKLLIISFHSLEDRIVKNFFKEQAKNNILKIITKKPITASIEEIKSNPRSRSAKLRVGQKL
ncbi:16S rRNA (cytosine(1402)-N(4))-methyltransferase RsmH [Candidatus Parcubacteria bacterium]|nr:16S rRNA (cytosine(1402)-N(4))-methyltransferase RsmH [Candidatus Parcubacteria bacterium]